MNPVMNKDLNQLIGLIPSWIAWCLAVFTHVMDVLYTTALLSAKCGLCPLKSPGNQWGCDPQEFIPDQNDGVDFLSPAGTFCTVETCNPTANGSRQRLAFHRGGRSPSHNNNEDHDVWRVENMNEDWLVTIFHRSFMQQPGSLANSQKGWEDPAVEVCGPSRST